MKISLVMATYNGTPFLQEQLDSIRRQTKQPDEVIIRDDCSTDKTVRFLNDYILDHNLVNWSVRVNENNLGHKRNFTTLIQEATGDVIFLCDQDDIWFDTKVETFVSCMQTDPSIRLLASNITPVYTSDDAVQVKTPNIKSPDHIKPLPFSSNWVRPNLPGCSYAIRKTLVDDYVKIWNEHDAHDAILWSCAYVQGGLAILPQSTMYFNRHDANASDHGKNDANYRILSIESDISVMRRALKNLELDKKTYKFIQKQITVYQNRVHILKNRQVVNQIRNVVNIRYYARPRFWVADLIYLIKS